MFCCQQIPKIHTITMPVGPSSSEITKAEKQPRRRLKGVIIEPLAMARVVAGMGGINFVVQKRKWQRVRVEMNLPQTSSSGNTLYRVWKLYFPKYDGLAASNDSEEESDNSDNDQSSSSGSEDESSSSGSEDESSTSGSESSSETESSSDDDDDDDDDDGDDDGGGGGGGKKKVENDGGATSDSSDMEPNDVDRHGSECHICSLPGELLCCDHCTKVFHITCLTPPLKITPKTDWRCPVCAEKKAVRKKNNKRKRPPPPLPRVDQATLSSSVSIKLASTVERLYQVFKSDEELEWWEFDLTRLMLKDRSPELKSARVLALVQAAIDDYDLSKMALDLSHTLSLIFISVYEVGWHQPKKKKPSKPLTTKKKMRRS